MYTNSIDINYSNNKYICILIRLINNTKIQMIICP